MVKCCVFSLGFWVSKYSEFKDEVGILYTVLYFRGQVRKHIVNSWNALVHGKDLPEFPEKYESLNRQVTFTAATTESLSQFTLSNIILRIFGVSDDPTSKVLQYFSLSTSGLSLALAFVTVSILRIYSLEQKESCASVSASKIPQTYESCNIWYVTSRILLMVNLEVWLSSLSFVYCLAYTFLHCQFGFNGR